MRPLLRKPVTYCLAMGILLIFGLLFLFQYRDFRSRRPDSTINIRYILRVQNTTNLAIKDAQVVVFAPVARTATQRCGQIKASRPHTVSKDGLGNQSIAFQWDIFPPLSTRFVTVQGDVKIWEKPQKHKTIEVKDFLRAEPFIESDDNHIRSQAEKLKAATSLQTVHTVFDWVADHISYSGYVSRNRGAAYALTYGKGDCTEYAALFVALCRANGIPARPLGGFVCSKSMLVDSSDYHNWAEFYLDNRWHIADPQNRKIMTNTPYYIAFQNIRPAKGLNGHLISEIKGKGLEVKIKPLSP